MKNVIFNIVTNITDKIKIVSKETKETIWNAHKKLCSHQFSEEIFMLLVFL